MRWANVPFAELKTPEVVKAVKVLLKKEGLVVDVGANTGEFLDFAREHGCKTLGVELSDESRQVLLRKGHDAVASLECITDESVDLIAAFDLVEHLHDVNGFFRLCKRKLKFGGWLVVLTGDISSLSAQYSGSKWWYCSYPEHISFPSLAFCESIDGLSLVESIETWAAKGYRVGWCSAILGCMVRSMLKRYRGLPSLGTDHRLYVFQRHIK
jgi:SAM-dependent methyltransferase